MFQIINIFSLAFCCLVSLGILSDTVKITIVSLLKLIVINSIVYILSLVFFAYCFGVKL